MARQVGRCIGYITSGEKSGYRFGKEVVNMIFLPEYICCWEKSKDLRVRQDRIPAIDSLYRITYY